MEHTKTIEILEGFINKFNRKSSPKTKVVYESVLRIFFTHIHGFDWKEKGIVNITIEDVYDYEEKLFSDGKADATVANSLTVIRSFFKYAHYLRLVDFPYPLIKTTKRGQNFKKFITLEEYEELDKFTSGYSFEDVRVRLMLNLLWDTGIRVSELVSLDISKINLNERMTSIIRRKNKNPNIIRWSQKTSSILSEYLSMRNMIGGCDALFISSVDNEKRMRIETVQRYLAKLSSDYGLGKKLKPHMLRHSKAHDILRQGGRLVDVSFLLGHTNIASSIVYARQSCDEQKRNADRFLRAEDPVKSLYPVIKSPVQFAGGDDFGYTTIG